MFMKQKNLYTNALITPFPLHLLSLLILVVQCLQQIEQVHEEMLVCKSQRCCCFLLPTGRKPWSSPLCIPEGCRKNKPACLTFAETRVATGSSYNSYRLAVKYKQRLRNSNQIDRLSRSQGNRNFRQIRQIQTMNLNHV